MEIQVSPIRPSTGYSLAEIAGAFVFLLVVGVLPAVVLQSGRPERVNTASALAKDLESLRQGLQRYVEKNGTYPCFDHAWDDSHEAAAIGPYVRWGKNPWGKEYHLETGATPAPFSISINIPTAEERQNVDTGLDDGNLSSGIFVASGDATAPYRLEYVGIPQPPVAGVSCAQQAAASGSHR